MANRLLRDMQTAAQAQDHEQVISLSKQLATTTTSTPEQKRLAAQFRLVALILADRISDITDEDDDSLLDAQHKDNATDPDAFSRFVRAYIMYRTNREQEALALLSGGTAATAKERILEAQIRYRLGDYSLAAQLFAGAQSMENDPDVQTNLLACCLFATKHLGVENDVSRRVLSGGSLSNFEVGFNAVLLQATNWISGVKGSPTHDEIKKWVASLKKICPEDEQANLEFLTQLVARSFDAPLSPRKVDDGGDVLSAIQLRQNKLITKLRDQSMRIEDRTENRKIFAQTLRFLDIPAPKQPSKESTGDGQNAQTILPHAKKTTFHRALLRGILRNCVILARRESSDLKSILGRLHTRAASDITAALVLSDVNLSYRLSSSLITTKELQTWVALRNVQHRLDHIRAPTLVELNRLSNAIKSGANFVRIVLAKSRRSPERVDWRVFAEKTAEDAIAFWKANNQEDAAARILFERGRHFFLRADFTRSMQDIEAYLGCKSLQRSAEEVSEATSIFIRAAARIDPSQANRLTSQLPTLNLQRLDVAKLEAIPLASLQKKQAAPPTDKEKEKRQAAAVLARRKKRHSKKAANRREKFAAQIAAGARPDPERWFPLKERSATLAKLALQASSQRRNRKRTKQATGTQGFAMTDATKQLQQSLDFSAKAAEGISTVKPKEESAKLPPHLRKLQKNPSKPQRR